VTFMNGYNDRRRLMPRLYLIPSYPYVYVRATGPKRLNYPGSKSGYTIPSTLFLVSLSDFRLRPPALLILVAAGHSCISCVSPIYHFPCGGRPIDSDTPSLSLLLLPIDYFVLSFPFVGCSCSLVLRGLDSCWPRWETGR
jgi:hypothetical protein